MIEGTELLEVSTVDEIEDIETTNLLEEEPVTIDAMFGELRDLETFSALCESGYQMTVFDLNACYSYMTHEKVEAIVDYSFVLLHVLIAFVIAYFGVKGLFEPWNNN